MDLYGHGYRYRDRKVRTGRVSICWTIRMWGRLYGFTSPHRPILSPSPTPIPPIPDPWVCTLSREAGTAPWDTCGS